MSRIDEAFKAVKRADFLPPEAVEYANIDEALSIGYGQTNSQPYTVSLMLEWLEPQPGENILDVGSGSGWTSALLGHLVSPKGRVYGVERVPELVKFGSENVKKQGLKNVSIHQVGKTLGLSEHAPYDRIQVAASADKIPTELLDQLKVGGRMVIPIKTSIWVIDKTGHDSYESFEHPGFVFVPLL